MFGLVPMGAIDFESPCLGWSLWDRWTLGVHGWVGPRGSGGLWDSMFGLLPVGAVDYRSSSLGCSTWARWALGVLVWLGPRGSRRLLGVLVWVGPRGTDGLRDSGPAVGSFAISMRTVLRADGYDASFGGCRNHTRKSV
jgi:hypothetical protein